MLQKKLQYFLGLFSPPNTFFTLLSAKPGSDLEPCHTQENYATQESSGMFHLMPQQHLPEWREEDERA